MWILCPSASIFFNWLKFFYHAQIIKCFCPQGTWKGLPFFALKVLYFTSITVHNNCAVLGRIARESNMWHHDSCYQQAIACFTSCYPLQWDFKQVSNTEVGTCSANHLKIKTLMQCCGSKYIEFGSRSGSRILAQFWSRSGSRVVLSILKEKIQNNFFWKIIFFKTSIHCHIKKFVISWVSELFINILNLTSFASMHVRIRIRIPNTDPGSSWIRIQYGSGSTTLLKWK